MKQESRCREKVHDGRFGFYQCLRTAGFGPDEGYCKQHARRHEKPAAEVTIWETPSKYSSGQLPKAVKVRENGEKTFVDSSGRRCKKSTDWNDYFDTEAEALRYCLNRAEKALAHAEKKVQEETAQIALFEAALEKVKP